VGKNMLDDIGLGSAIVNAIYLVIFLFGILGVWVFVKLKLKSGLLFWISSMLNLFFYLYLMGNYRFYPKFIYLFINKYWPWVNLALFILLIINFFKNKNVKNKNK
jgi:hypothetical protein